MDRTELFVCQCHDVAHQLIMSTIDDNREVYCSFHLDNYGFWKRCKSAFLYVIGKERKDGDFDCMLIKPEDSGRLSSFLDYLDGQSKVSPFKDEAESKSFVEKNSGRIWKVTRLFSYNMESEEHIHNLSIEKGECISHPEMGFDYDIIHKVSMKKRSLFVRPLLAIKHIFGYRSCYVDFDSYELTEKDVPALRQFIKILQTI